MSVENLAKIWPEWEIEKQLGRGSYGVVYKAVRRDNNVESHAAIKVISIPSDESEVDSLLSEGLDMDGTRTYFKGIVDDFVSEIQLMESLKGIQNIVSVEDYKVVERTDSIGWDIYIRMELLTPFNTFVCDKKLSEKDVIKLGIDICTALEICSQRNIIHRDIKPENIFVNDFGYFKLGDFGIARKLENMTGGLSQKGTFNYMAPEVANSNAYDARVDTYSLGIVLYRLLNGNRLPFLDTEKQLLNPNERKNAVERRIRGEELPAPCAASAEMANLILRACAYSPDMRFASATAMKEALIGVDNGTYVLVATDLDKTTAVRHAQADCDATTAVRKAPQAAGAPVQNNANSKNEAVPTFGKKKSKAPKIVAIVLVLALLVGGVFVAYPYISDLLSNSTSDNNDTGIPENTITGSTNGNTIGTPNDNTTNTTNGGETGNPDNNTGLTDDENIQSIINDAERMANSNHLDNAINKIEEGLATYPNSAELQNKLDEYTAKKALTESLNQATLQMQAGSYDEALATLDTAEQLYGVNSEITTKRSEVIKAKGLYTLSQYESASDYKSAIKFIDENMQNYASDVDVLSKRNLYVTKYKTQVLSQAESVYASDNYKQALSILNSALSILPGDPDVIAAIEKYTPVPYAEIPSNIRDYLVRKEDITTDSKGNTYNDQLVFYADFNTYNDGSKSFDKPCIEQYTGGKYSKFKATIIPHKEMDEYNKGCGAVVKIYADDRLVYTSSTITRKGAAVNVDLNITGVQYLKIQVEPTSSLESYSNNYTIILADAKVFS